MVTAQENKEYILTDQCSWKELSEAEQKNYNPYDKTRHPHCAHLVDTETGTIVNVPSGSIIKITKIREIK